MTYEQFLQILLSYQAYDRQISDAYDIGIDLLEGKFATNQFVTKILEASITSHYGEEGWDWVGWFMWENDFGQEGMEAYDENKNLICQSFEQLYNYLEQNHKLK